MLPNINIFNSIQIKDGLKLPDSKNDQFIKVIENKIQLQTKELNERAKIIEELKLSLTLFIDKYNNLKKTIEKGAYNPVESANFENKKSKFKIEKFALIFKASKTNESKDLKVFEDNYILMMKKNQEQEEKIKTNQTLIEKLKKLLDENEKQAAEIKLSYEEKIKFLDDMNKNLNKEKSEALITFNTLIFEHANCQFKIAEMENQFKSLSEENNNNNNNNSNKKKIKLLEENNEKLRLVCQDKEFIINQLNTQIETFRKQLDDYNKLNGEQTKSNYKIVEKLEKELKEINLRNSFLEQEDKNNKYWISELLNKLENVKNSSINFYENMNLKFLEFDKIYTKKINKYRDRIEILLHQLTNIRSKTKTNVRKYNCLEIKTGIQLTFVRSSTKKTEELNYKLIIEKFKKEKNELKIKIDELEKIIENLKNEKNLLQNKIEKTPNNTIISDNKILKSKLDWLEKEYNKFIKETEPELKRCLEDFKNRISILSIKNKDLENIASQYKIENDGKSKIISELTEEVNSLKSTNTKL